MKCENWNVSLPPREDTKCNRFNLNPVEKFIRTNFVRSNKTSEMEKPSLINAFSFVIQHFPNTDDSYNSEHDQHKLIWVPEFWEDSEPERIFSFEWSFWSSKRQARSLFYRLCLCDNTPMDINVLLFAHKERMIKTKTATRRSNVPAAFWRNKTLFSDKWFWKFSKKIISNDVTVVVYCIKQKERAFILAIFQCPNRTVVYKSKYMQQVKFYE